MPKERPIMRKTRAVVRATEPAKSGVVVVISNAKEGGLSVESDLSPERMEKGASTTTLLLAEILARQEEPHQVRDWGINE